MSKDEFISELATVEKISPQEASERAAYLERTYVFCGWHEAFVREVATDWSDCRPVGLSDDEWKQESIRRQLGV